MHQCQREVLTRAYGLFALEFTVANKMHLLAQGDSLEPIHQLSKRSELLFARMRLFKVTNQTYTNGCLVNQLVFDVPA